MAWTVRSVRPTIGLMSRIRASGLRVISTSTCPCPVSSVQDPPLPSSPLMSPSVELTSDFPREKTHEVFLVFILTGHPGRTVKSVSRLSTQPTWVFQVACWHVRRPAWFPGGKTCVRSGGGAGALWQTSPDDQRGARGG